MNHRHQSRTKNQPRRGAAAVEAALISPLVVMLVLVALDIGQFVNVAQTVSNASREGARVASRNSTGTAAQVEAAVHSYLQNSFPNLDAQTLNNATVIEVLDSNGAVVAGGDLFTLNAGSEMSVRVEFEFSSVRWLKGIQAWTGDTKETITVARRE